MSWIFLEADDVWCFRDNTPKLVGGSTVMHSLFPPTPSTIQGVVRSLILGESDVDWAAYRQQSTAAAQQLGTLIGHPASNEQEATLGQFSMAGPFLARREVDEIMIYAPMPNDVKRNKEQMEQLFTMQPSRAHHFDSNWPAEALSPLWLNAEESESLDGEQWLSGRNLRAYLQSNAFGKLDASVLYARESRLGIEIDYTVRNAAERMLYQTEFIRPSPGVGLLIWVANAIASAISDQGTLRIGGEGRNAYYCTVPDTEVIYPTRFSSQQSTSQPSPSRLKLVLLTPAFFDGGWQPKAGDVGWSELLGASVSLVSASIGHPQRAGGWDIAARNGRGWHKPIVSYVPAGSVYYFETTEAVEPDRFHSITQTPTEQPLPLDALGYGQFALGTWEWL